MTVDFYNTTVHIGTIVADGRATTSNSACHGPFQRFDAFVGVGAHNISAVVHDLDSSGTTTLLP